MPEYSKHQRGIIKRYYDNRDTIALNKLSEALSNLYLETSETKIKRTWTSVCAQLVACGIPKKRADEIVADRDIDILAQIIQDRV